MDQGRGVYDVYERLCREVAGPFPLGGGEGAFCLVVLGDFSLDIVVDALQFLYSLVRDHEI